MNLYSTETYQSPPLLFLVCFMGAMAFVVASYRWFWLVIRNTDSAQHSFNISVWRGQVLSFIFVMIISVFVGVYDYNNSARFVNIFGEVLILVGSIVFSYIKARNNGSIKLMIYHFRELFLFGFACILGWVVTISIGYSLIVLFRAVGINGIDGLAVFVTGLLWLLPILLMFSKVKNNPKVSNRLNNLGVHKFLWSIMLAYLMLLMPLMIQDMANSKKWKEIENAKIIRRA